jgi:hypothetical protein
VIGIINQRSGGVMIIGRGDVHDMDLCIRIQPEVTVFFTFRLRQNQGVFAKRPDEGRDPCTPLNSTDYTAVTPIAFFSAYCFKKPVPSSKSGVDG